MTATKRTLPRSVVGILRCPVCREILQPGEEKYVCTRQECNIGYPVVDGIPVLINERNSVFSISDFIQGRDTTLKLRQSRFSRLAAALTPSISRNVKAERNYKPLARHLRATPSRVLVVGGSIVGQGMDGLIENENVEIVETDVSFGPRTMLVCDGHDLPFDDESFDCVIAQAVLEHVMFPQRCVDEIHRVLKPAGMVYAETPFMQQVHLGKYDFTRFTHLGHRVLFRRFEEIESGAMCGPGMALAWSYQYFLLSFSESRYLRSALRTVASMTAFFLKYFDHFLIDNPAALDAASGCYFLGRKSERSMTQKELLQCYRGAM